MFEPVDKSTTRDRILDAAEQLFAEHGFDGTSIREVTRAAGVNVAAVHYHFGSKEAVLRGVTDRIAGPINARRHDLLGDLLKGSDRGRPTLEELIDCFVRADVEVLLELQQRGPTVARFLGRTYSDQTEWIQEMAREQYAAATLFYSHIGAALSHLDRDEVVWRVRQMVAVIVNLFATWPEEGMTRPEAARLLDRLVTFLAGGLRAPAPATVSRR